jgi:hypothetical protein
MLKMFCSYIPVLFCTETIALPFRFVLCLFTFILFNASHLGLTKIFIIAEAEQVQLHSLPPAAAAAALSRTSTASLNRSLPCTNPANLEHHALNSTHNIGRSASDLTGQMLPNRSSASCPPGSSSLPSLRIAAMMSDSGTHTATAHTTKGSSNSSSLTVRELLLSTRGKGGWYNGKVLPSVTGVVVYKGLLSESNETVKGSNQEGYKSFCQLQQKDYWQNNWFPRPTAIRKCKVVLRDVLYGDIVTMYVPVSLAGCAVVGMHVALLNCTVHLTSSKGQLYLKESRDTQIGTVDCIALLAQCCAVLLELYCTVMCCSVLYCTVLCCAARSQTTSYHFII